MKGQLSGNMILITDMGTTFGIMKKTLNALKVGKLCTRCLENLKIFV